MIEHYIAHNEKIPLQTDQTADDGASQARPGPRATRNKPTRLSIIGLATRLGPGGQALREASAAFCLHRFTAAHNKHLQASFLPDYSNQSPQPYPSTQPPPALTLHIPRTLNMSVVSLLGVEVKNNPAPFDASYEFEITFECLEQLQKGK